MQARMLVPAGVLKSAPRGAYALVHLGGMYNEMALLLRHAREAFSKEKPEVDDFTLALVMFAGYLREIRAVFGNTEHPHYKALASLAETAIGDDVLDPEAWDAFQTLILSSRTTVNANDGGEFAKIRNWVTAHVDPTAVKDWLAEYRPDEPICLWDLAGEEADPTARVSYYFLSHVVVGLRDVAGLRSLLGDAQTAFEALRAVVVGVAAGLARQAGLNPADCMQQVEVH